MWVIILPVYTSHTNLSVKTHNTKMKASETDINLQLKCFHHFLVLLKSADLPRLIIYVLGMLHPKIGEHTPLHWHTKGGGAVGAYCPKCRS